MAGTSTRGMLRSPSAHTPMFFGVLPITTGIWRPGQGFFGTNPHPHSCLHDLHTCHSPSAYRDLVISHIIPGLLCGSIQSMTGSRKADAPLNPEVFRQHHITHVLSLGERPPLHEIPVKNLFIDVEVCTTEPAHLLQHQATYNMNSFVWFIAFWKTVCKQHSKQAAGQIRIANQMHLSEPLSHF